MYEKQGLFAAARFELLDFPKEILQNFRIPGWCQPVPCGPKEVGNSWEDSSFFKTLAPRQSWRGNGEWKKSRHSSICKCYDNSLTIKHTLTFPSLQCTSVRLWEKITVHQTVWIRVDCYQCWQRHPLLPLSTCKHGWGLQWLRWDCDDARRLQVPGERQNATVVAWYLWYFRLVVLIMLQRHLKIGKIGSQVELFPWSTLLLLSLFWDLKAPTSAHLNIWQSETPQIDMSKSWMPTEVIRILDDEAMPLTRAWCLPLGHSKDFETHHLQQGKHWKIHEGITNYMHR